MSNTGTRARETDNTESERFAKRLKTDGNSSIEPSEPGPDVRISSVEPEFKFSSEDLLPLSRSLLPSRKTKVSVGKDYRVSEPDVGISEYIANDIPQIEGIIKQRYVRRFD